LANHIVCQSAGAEFYCHREEAYAHNQIFDLVNAERAEAMMIRCVHRRTFRSAGTLFLGVTQHPEQQKAL
jgi:hypothetical protein